RLYKLQKPKVASGINNTGLVGYWPLDEGQGTRAEDASFNNNTGTLILGPTWTSGKIGGAVNLDGSDDYVDLGNDSSLEVPLPFALSVWVKIRSLPSVNYNIIATDAHTGSSIYSGSGIWINSDGSVEIDYGDSISTGGSNHRRTKLSGAGLITANTWYHIVAVARGATDMNLYVNGVDVGGSYSGTGNAQVFSSDTAKIGSNAWGTLNAFSGSIDDARVYNRALSAGEVYALYKGTKATVVNKTNKNRVTDGLIGYWTFDGKDIYGTKANDVSSNGNTGTLTGGPTPVIGKLGQALSFDGVDDYLNTTNTVNIAKVTISAWIKIPSIPSTNNTIVGFANGFNHGTHDKVLYIKNDGKLYFYVYDGSANTTSAPSSTLPLKTWVHVVGIADGTTARTYVNGVEVGSVLSGNTYTSYGVPDIFIGAPISTGTYTYFNGQMDDVRVYNRALTVEEIKTLYSLGR
ncbi:MAG: LamG domain-containing protein, partial [Nitrospira sp.]